MRSRRPTARSWRTRWPRSGAKTLDWDRETAAKYRKDLEAKGMVFVEEKDGLDVDGFRKAVLAQVNKDFPEWTGYIEQIRAVK